MPLNSPQRTEFVRRILREPFLHFLILGAVIFAVGELWTRTPEDLRIVVGPDLVRQIAVSYQKQYGSAPSERQLKSLLDSHLREEILYREGMALHLDRDDEIVRRRIAQKYEFLQQDLAVVRDPTEAELERHYQAHREQYASPQRISFTHIYFSPDQGGDEQAAARAGQVLKTLGGAATRRAPQLGDRFPDLYDYSALGPVEVSRVFGESPFAAAIFHAPLNQWAGPFKSGFGWHLVYVSAREAARVRPLAEVREKLLADYRDQARQQKNAEAFEQLKKKYTIIENGTADGPAH